MLSYYFNLPKDRKRDFQENINASYAIQKTAKTAFEPFEVYLKNAIDALEKKENIKAKWKKVNIENLAELKIVGGLFEIPKQTIIQFEEGAIETAKVGDTIMGSANPHKILSIEKNEVVLDIIPEPDEMLFWNKKPLNFSVIHSEKPEGILIREEPDRYIVYSQENIHQAKRIPDNKLSSFIDFENLCLENGAKLSATRNEGLSIILSNTNDYNKKVTSNQIRFTIEKIRENSKDAFWIQLIELDENGNDDIPGFSPLRYFFDDNITITDDKNNEYQIAAGIESENKIVLKGKVRPTKGGFSWGYCFPPDGSVLAVKVNTYPLKKQKEAISTLLQMPVGEQAKLIKLFENRDKIKWQEPENKSVEEWFVITEESRSGSREQRKFIHQAINTPDFAILEGPPGSGKTTVILELICQLAQQGKRILLCGSTHVAIDNVLERLKEKRNGKNLLNQFNILPVRIGDEKRINEDIREFQIDNLINDNSIDQTLLLEASNLVCGTTIGILQHPKFKNRSKNWRDTPIIPEFDYLIIDECSKTTFQEFLVPALYAKKWILVGDVMQLSPFTEREQIVCSIEQISIDEKPLPYELQQAVFFLHKLKNCLYHKNNKYVLPVSQDTLQFIIQELEAGRSDDFKDKLIFAVSSDISETTNQIILRKPNELNTLELSSADLILIADALLDKTLSKLPESHAVLLSTQWIESAHAFTHNAYQKQHPFQYKEKGKEITDSMEIVKQLNGYFYEKNWAEEVAWRIDREHQLRMAIKSKIKGNYGKVIGELLPKSVDKEKVESQINQIASIAFPSILESLVKGISGRKMNFESTISEGFRKDDLDKRKTTLVYQHRMHPEISKFPREQFYQTENALNDLEKPKPIQELRAWNYNKYESRSIWIDVRGKTVKNYNQKEVDVLIQHLEIFLEYAENNPQPEGKEWTVACLTFYRGQETLIREKLQKLTGNENGFSNFNVKGKHKINIKLHTVDKFQGHEADIVFLSMVQTSRDGFLDNPNRLNVAITRAKFQLVIIGHHEYFLTKSQSNDLKELAQTIKAIQ